MNASGLITRCVVPSRQAVLNAISTGRRLQRLVGWRGHLDEFRRALDAAPVHTVQHQAVQVNVQVVGTICLRTGALHRLADAGGYAQQVLVDAHYVFSCPPVTTTSRLRRSRAAI